ncbi:hypothetical protein EYF80_014812 [Liparis tanakae]|uniref:Uncharacterized protein n=1 Tax=Liparis tanakae TaxID=230148 RepID=A0A4Z2IC31_9TELE|nr:hypothetical protein EYF80_014812 [Liparis tanakae]
MKKRESGQWAEEKKKDGGEEEDDKLRREEKIKEVFSFSSVPFQFTSTSSSCAVLCINPWNYIMAQVKPSEVHYPLCNVPRLRSSASLQGVDKNICNRPRFRVGLRVSTSLCQTW